MPIKSKKKKRNNNDGMLSFIKNLFSFTQDQLYESIKNKNFIECQRIIQNGINLNVLYNGYTMLFWCFYFLDETENELDKRDYYDIIRLLLINGADINQKMIYETHYLYVTLLMIFTIKNKIRFVEFLLNQDNININETDLIGRTALMYAVKSNRPTILNLLLEHDANIYIKDKNGTDALYHTNNHPPLRNPILRKHLQNEEKKSLDFKKIGS